jgi:DNA-directed RNA polymerase I and III subunit RPAC2
VHWLTRTAEGTNVTEALEKGLNDLMDLCDVVTDKFGEATRLNSAMKQAARA